MPQLQVEPLTVTGGNNGREQVLTKSGAPVPVYAYPIDRATLSSEIAPMNVLVELRNRRLLSRLAQRLRPPITRQSIQAWEVVPFRYLKQVATLTGVPPGRLRPDLNRKFNLARALSWDTPSRHSEFWIGSPSPTSSGRASPASK